MSHFPRLTKRIGGFSTLKDVNTEHCLAQNTDEELLAAGGCHSVLSTGDTGPKSGCAHTPE